MCIITMNGYIVIIAVMMACWMCQNQMAEGAAVNTIPLISSDDQVHNQESVGTNADYHHIISIIEGLQSRLSAVEEENKQLKNMMSASENRETILEEQNNHLKDQIYKLSDEINNLEKKLAVFNNRFNEVPQDTRPFKSMNDKKFDAKKEQNGSNQLLGQEYQHCLSKWQAQEEQNNNFKDKISQLDDYKTKMQSSFVSFSAYPPDHRTYDAGQVVLFDIVLKNYGNFYNGTTSIFTCPFTAYYSFSSHIIASSKQRMATVIVQNGTSLVRTYAHDLDTFGASSNSVVTLCESGQDVYIRANYNESSMDPWSTFSGTLLRIL